MNGWKELLIVVSVVILSAVLGKAVEVRVIDSEPEKTYLKRKRERLLLGK